MASSVPVPLPPWSETPQEILGLVIDRLASSAGPDHRTRRRFSAVWSKILGAVSYAADGDYHRGFQVVCRARQAALSADRARFRAVCRSWCSAMRQHLRTSRLLPWVIMSDGSFLMPSDDKGRVASRRRLPTFPENSRCIGSTDDWLALDCTDAKNRHTYLLHNPFSDTTVPLTELSDIIGNATNLFKVRKVLMRSTPGDVVALMTNNWNYPVILVRPGKGLWLPEPRTAPFVYIIDIAFIGDKLYGITQAEDLVSLAIDYDNDGSPRITGIKRLIRHPPRYYRFEVWMDGQDDDGNLEAKNSAVGEYGFAYSECQLSQEEHDKSCALDALREETGDDMLLEGSTYLQDNEVPYESKDAVTVIWHLVESCGKLLMVRRILQEPNYSPNYTRKVEVFEACARKGVWMPLSNELRGQALFISRRFSRSISAYGDVKEDTIYFVDTGEMFNIKSQTISAPQRMIDRFPTDDVDIFP